MIDYAIKPSESDQAEAASLVKEIALLSLWHGENSEAWEEKTQALIANALAKRSQERAVTDA